MAPRKKQESAPTAPEKKPKGHTAYDKAKAEKAKQGPPQSAREVGEEAQAKKAASKKKDAPASTEVPADQIPELFEEARTRLVRIRELYSTKAKHQALAKKAEKEIELLDAEVAAIVIDQDRGQLHLPLNDAANKAASGAPGKIEALAFTAACGPHKLRVESRAPGEWTPMLDGKDGSTVKASAADAKYSAEGMLPKSVDNIEVSAWEPDEKWAPPAAADVPLSTTFVAKDGTRTLTASQTTPGKWTVRDEQGRPLAQDLPLAKAQKTAMAEFGIKVLDWARVDAPTTATEKKPANVPTDGTLFDEALPKGTVVATTPNGETLRVIPRKKELDFTVSLKKPGGAWELVGEYLTLPTAKLAAAQEAFVHPDEIVWADASTNDVAAKKAG